MTTLQCNVSVDMTDYEVVAMSEGGTDEYTEEDGVDWCAWWADYAEAME
ncbi:MAG: hypothetical protein GFH27_549291n9 [Chloroflexi bacterium AL-W]|nr:hypothetical protein [Chloroflexi bacterium AL-N1]NOK67524.1 hypothetical protein [Chloroflexi bacterium AL-N10]NOK74984.1 hypothetical protein [Chloroflexi bacterium AL-N5]NOK81771.1 hypothetical protein [Chloroflexi bacterium AL-W]NOK89617.1 hypothetical protein [Chloroflexi bacterium AL-N15]